MTNKEIKEWILNNCFYKNGSGLKGVLYETWLVDVCNQQIILDTISESTSPAYKFSDRIRLFLSSTYNHQCHICGSEIPNLSRTFCSYACSNKFISNNKNISDKKRRTNLERYGVEYTGQSESVKAKIKSTFIENYGVDNPLKDPGVMAKLRATNLERYGVEHTGQSELVKAKIKSTFIENYGVDNPSKDPLVKEKKEKTNLERYGVLNTWQSEEKKDKIKQTNIERYGVEYSAQSEEIKDRIKTTFIENYGVDHPWKLEEIRDNIKQTNLELYGVEYASQSPVVQERMKSTNLERYGVVNTWQSEEIKDRIKATNLERYGVENASQSGDIKQKKVDTCLHNYGVEYSFQSEEVKSKSRATNLERYGDTSYIRSQRAKEFTCERRSSLLGEDATCCLENKAWLTDAVTELGTSAVSKLLNVDVNYIYAYCRKLSVNLPGYTISSGHQEIIDFISLHYSGPILINDRTLIKPLEVDIYLPEKQVAIEFDGLYWHSYGLGDVEDPDYHRIKTDRCTESGVQLLHIFENEWMDPIKQDIWKDIILNKIGIVEFKIGARQCTIAKIDDTSFIRSFFNTNHLQGYNSSGNINFALVFNNQIVSIMSFGKSRFNKNTDYELIRFATLNSYKVMGGASRLLKAFRREYPGSISTYANKRFSNGILYNRLGFDSLKDSSPNYWYWRDDFRLFNRIQFQKHKLVDILEIFDINKTESENCFDNGYRRIWDSGNKVYYLKH